MQSVQNVFRFKKVVKVLSWLLTVVLFLSLCMNTKPLSVSAAGESFNRKQVVLFLGDSVYSVNQTYLEVTSGNPVKMWTSSNKNVATVTPDGTVKATGLGKTTISAQTKAGTATVEVEVVKMPERIELVDAPHANKSDSHGRSYPNNDSVHDPEIIYVEEEQAYYMLCTHNTTIRKSTDLIKWTNTVRLTDGYADTARKFVSEYGNYGNVGSFWAPHIFYNPVTKKYHVYYSVSNTLNDGGRGFGNKCSAIGMAVLEPVEGEEYSLGSLNNWVDGGIVVKSYDAWRRGGKIQSGSGEFKFGMDNEASAAFGPNAIDPTVLFDKDEERLYMVYGSFFSGIYVLELDPQTGLPFDQESLDPNDENYEVRHNTGILVANRGGSYAFAEPLDGLRKTQAGIEGPTIFYSEETGYYYLVVSYDYLDSTYNMRVGRSKNITGPFYDYNGFNMITYTEENVNNGLNMDYVFSNKSINENPNLVPNPDLGDKDGMLVEDTLSYDPNVGTKVMGPYIFENGSQWRATGHNSVFKAANGKWMYGMHAKDPNQRLHIRSIIWTEDGWPLASPARYAGENIDQPIDASYVAGEFELAIHDRLAAPNNYYARGVKAKLEADGTISSSNSNYTGTWKMYEANTIEISIGESIYKGKVSVGWDWENWDQAEIVLAAINDDGTMLWGKGGDPSTATPITFGQESSYSYTVRAGTSVTIPLIIDNAQNFAGVEATISYDSSLLTLQDVTWNENDYEWTVKSSNITQKGEIKLLGLGVNALTEDSIKIAYAKFLVTDSIDESAVTTALKVESCKVNNIEIQPMNTAVSDSYITIVDVLLGDINGDGKVDLTDIMMAAQFVTGKLNLTPSQIYAADMNGDGEVDLTDVMMMTQVALYS